MSTVGFIGAAPEPALGRLVSSVLMVSGFALMAMVTAAIASLFVREEQELEEEAQELFDAQALRLLTDIAQRLEPIETTLASSASDTEAPAAEPPEEAPT